MTCSDSVGLHPARWLAGEPGLVERAKTDPEAFGELYDHYVGPIYRFALRRVRDPHTAEDVTADVFLRALGAISRYEDRGQPFGAWLHRIAANAVIDHHRARRHRAGLVDGLAAVVAPGPSPEDDLVAADAATALWRAIDTLPPGQRAAMAWRAGADLKVGGIAARMGRSELAVKLLLHRARAGVRARILAVDDTSSEGARRGPA